MMMYGSFYRPADKHEMRSALTFVLLCLFAATSAAQERPNPCAATATANPADVSLTLSLTDGQTVFHEGEIIGLTLAFSSTASNKYFLDTRNYDRSGRLDAEAFCLEPDTGRDPLDDYFRSGLSGFMGGGIGGYEPLKT